MNPILSWFRRDRSNIEAILATGPATGELFTDAELDPHRVQTCDAWLAGWFGPDTLYPGFPVGHGDRILQFGAEPEVRDFCEAKGAKALDPSITNRCDPTGIICLGAFNTTGDASELLTRLAAAGTAGTRYLLAFPSEWQSQVGQALGSPTCKQGYDRVEARDLVEAAGLRVVHQAGDAFYSIIRQCFDAARRAEEQRSAASPAWAGCWAAALAGRDGSLIQAAMNDLLPARHLLVAVKPGGEDSGIVSVEKRSWPTEWHVPQDPAAAYIDHFQINRDLDAKAGWFASASQEVAPGFRVGPEDTVLDLGCGSGTLAGFCAATGAEMIVADICPDNVEATKRHAFDQSGRKATGIVTDANPIPLPDGCASVVICTEVLEHVAEPVVVMAELVRVAKPGARFLLTVPGELSEHTQQRLAPPQYFEPPNHIRIVSEREFRTMVERAGLTIEYYEADLFHHSFHLLLFWQTCVQLNESHHLFRLWMRAWQMATSGPRGREIQRVLDKVLPRRQVIFARKKLDGDV